MFNWVKVLLQRYLDLLAEHGAFKLEIAIPYRDFITLISLLREAKMLPALIFAGKLYRNRVFRVTLDTKTNIIEISFKAV